MEIRSFLAFELPEEIRNILRLVLDDVRKIPLDIRLVKVYNIHLTVVFLGNITTKNLNRLHKIVKKVCHGYGPFNISLKGAGIFGGRRNPKVLWVGLTGDIEMMSHFRDTLQRQLNPFGVKPEKRRFKPHLTIGRFRKSTSIDARLDKLLSGYESLTSQECTLGKLVLFKSNLTPSGAVYTSLNSYHLEGENVQERPKT